jgi:SAM-dependent methyltransferase
MSIDEPGNAVGYAERYDPDLDFDRWYTAATAAAIEAWLRSGDSVLELGCATGAMTSVFVATVVGVEREPAYLARARARGLAAAEFVRGDVEDFRTDRSFDHVVATNIVHEVRDPGQLFAQCREHLAPRGRLHVSLQNPESVHRLVGKAAGWIENLTDLSVRGVEYSTMRMLGADDLVMLGRGAGLRCVHRAGIMLKPLPNSLMEALPDATVEAFVQAAHLFPNNCAMNYLVFETDPSATP